jgi:hypothetical protein
MLSSPSAVIAPPGPLQRTDNLRSQVGSAHSSVADSYAAPYPDLGAALSWRNDGRVGIVTTPVPTPGRVRRGVTASSSESAEKRRPAGTRNRTNRRSRHRPENARPRESRPDAGSRTGMPPTCRARPSVPSRSTAACSCQSRLPDTGRDGHTRPDGVLVVPSLRPARRPTERTRGRSHGGWLPGRYSDRSDLGSVRSR